MQARYIPIAGAWSPMTTPPHSRAALRDLPGPVLAYCRSGTRSATLWSLARPRSRPLPEILAATKAAGYDMTGVARRIANGGAHPDRPGRCAATTW